MNLASFASFIVNIFGLCIVVGLIFLALDSPYIRLNEWIKRFAKFAVGGAACLAFIIYCLGVFAGVGGGAGLMRASPESIIEFAIGVLLIIGVLYIIEFVIAWLLGGPPADPVTAPPAGLAGIVIFVVNLIAIVVILILAEKALFGGGLGLIPNFTGLGVHQQPTQVR
jgi:hypothetical protein